MAEEKTKIQEQQEKDEKEHKKFRDPAPVPDYENFLHNKETGPASKPPPDAP